MTKQQWQEIHAKLIQERDDFNFGYYDSINGKNDSVRKTGKSKYNSCINKVVFMVNTNPELASLMYEGYDQPIMSTMEFLSPSIFYEEIEKLLKKISDKIKKL